jgi:hypothetical protein
MSNFSVKFFRNNEKCSVDHIRQEELFYEKRLKDNLQKHGLSVDFAVINHHGLTLEGNNRRRKDV